MARKPKARDDLSPTEGPNLIPIMNLVVCLIPLALLGTSLIKVGVVDLPHFGSTTPGPEPVDPPAIVTLKVMPEGYWLASSAFDVSEALGVPPAETGHLVPRSDEAYDVVALYNAMATLKAAHPDATQVILRADGRVPFKEILRVSDVLRNKLIGSPFADGPALAQAEIAVDAEGRPEALFGDVGLGPAL